MTSPTAEALQEVLDHACNIAPQLTADARWLWIEAYWPAGRNPDRPTRLAPRRHPGDDPDDVPGERLALGAGNDQARAAYTRAATSIVDAHRLAGRALAHYTGRRAPTGYQRPARGDEFATWVAATVRRLRQLLSFGVADGDDEQPRLDAHAAAVALIAAHAALTAVMRDVDGSKELPPERRCEDCGKACEDQKRKRCWQCVQRRARGKRPVRRWAEQHAAKERRVRRGEDYAANPLPKGRYVEGEWEAS